MERHLLHCVEAKGRRDCGSNLQRTETWFLGPTPSLKLLHSGIYASKYYIP